MAQTEQARQPGTGVDRARRRWLFGSQHSPISPISPIRPVGPVNSTGPVAPGSPGAVSVLGHCLARQRVECRSCGDACDTRAIRFQLQLGGPALPQVDAQACNGCGDCLRVCPVSALALSA